MLKHLYHHLWRLGHGFSTIPVNSGRTRPLPGKTWGPRSIVDGTGKANNAVSEGASSQQGEREKE